MLYEYLIFIIFFGIALTVAWAALSLAPWLPMHSKDLRRVFALAKIKPGEVFYDVGCGNGKVVLYAAARHQARAVGLELALPLLWLCKGRRLFSPARARISFRWKNLFKADLSSADVVYFFGLPGPIRERLKQKLEQELRPGTRVVSYTFAIDGWHPTEVNKPSSKDIPIYLYVR